MVIHWASVMIGAPGAPVETAQSRKSGLKRWADGPIGTAPEPL
jgi:hypothetical protein